MVESQALGISEGGSSNVVSQQSFKTQVVCSVAAIGRRKTHVSLFDDLINYELCFTGAVTGSTEVECPHCGESFTVPVNDPMGEESYQCCEFSGGFDVDWGEGVVRSET